MEQGSPAPDRSPACGRIHALTLVQPNLDPLEPPPPPPEKMGRVIRAQRKGAGSLVEAHAVVLHPTGAALEYRFPTFLWGQ